MAKPNKGGNLRPLPVGGKATDDARENAASTTTSVAPGYDPTDFDQVLAAEDAAAQAEFSEADSGTTARDDQTAFVEDPDAPGANAETDESRQSAAATVDTAAGAAAPGAADAPIEGAGAAATAAAKPAAQDVAPKTAQAAPVALDPKETIALGPNLAGTREEIIQALNQGYTQSQRAAALEQNAQGWQTLFGMPLDQAMANWKPYLDRLRATPGLPEYLDRAIRSYDRIAKYPGLEKYLDESTDHYIREKGWEYYAPGEEPGAPRQQQPAPQQQQQQIEEAINRAVDARLKPVLDRQAVEAEHYVRQEQASLVAEFPELADPAFMELVIRDTVARNVQDPRVTLTSNARAIVGKIREKYGSPAPAPAAAPAEAPTGILGSSGAAPRVRTADASGEQVFENADAALSDWLKNRKSLMRSVN